MRRTNRLTYKDLIEKNKEELLSDQRALDKIKEKLDDKLVMKMQKNYN